MTTPAADTVRSGFRQQAAACQRLGSPFNALVCTVLADNIDRSTAFGSRVLDWQPDRVLSDAVALRCCATLHAEVRSGEAPRLAAVYPPNAMPAKTSLWAAILDALSLHDAAMTQFLDRPPQTNEIARSAVLLGGFLRIARETSLPLSVFEIGSSAGLNLLFDHYAYDFGAARWGNPAGRIGISCEYTGSLPDLAAPLRVLERAGCDANPLDPTSSADRQRLLASIWPDQPHRLERTEAALVLAAETGIRVEMADAADWAKTKLAQPGPPGVARVLFHSIVRQYLQPATREALRETIMAAGARATPEQPFSWLAMEPGTSQEAALKLMLWPGGQERFLAHVDYHGRWAHWC
jgi:hypothetical protein